MPEPRATAARRGAIIFDKNSTIIFWIAFSQVFTFIFRKLSLTLRGRRETLESVSICTRFSGFRRYLAWAQNWLVFSLRIEIVSMFVAKDFLTYDVGPASLDPAKPDQDAANHSSSDFCPTS